MWEAAARRRLSETRSAPAQTGGQAGVPPPPSCRLGVGAPARQALPASRIPEGAAWEGPCAHPGRAAPGRHVRETFTGNPEGPRGVPGDRKCHSPRLGHRARNPSASSIPLCLHGLEPNPRNTKQNKTARPGGDLGRREATEDAEAPPCRADGPVFTALTFSDEEGGRVGVGRGLCGPQVRGEEDGPPGEAPCQPARISPPEDHTPSRWG